MPSGTEFANFAVISGAIVVAGIAAFLVPPAIARRVGKLFKKEGRALRGARFGCVLAVIPAAFFAFFAGAPWGGGMLSSGTLGALSIAFGVALWLFVPVVVAGLVLSVLLIALPGGADSEA